VIRRRGGERGAFVISSFLKMSFYANCFFRTSTTWPARTCLVPCACVQASSGHLEAVKFYSPENSPSSRTTCCEGDGQGGEARGAGGAQGWTSGVLYYTKRRAHTPSSPVGGKTRTRERPGGARRRKRPRSKKTPLSHTRRTREGRKPLRRAKKMERIRIDGTRVERGRGLSSRASLFGVHLLLAGKRKVLYKYVLSGQTPNVEQPTPAGMGVKETRPFSPRFTLKHFSTPLSSAVVWLLKETSSRSKGRKWL